MGPDKNMRVVFLHPDLGIGGAERLVVDAALALQSQGHTVHFVTSHHAPDHCFEETKNGTLDVTVVGDWLPRNMFGAFNAFCAYIRMIYAAFFLMFVSDLQPDIVFCDQISVCIPFLKLKHIKVIFYCHFPDQLLTHRNNYMKLLYRMPLDYLEEISIGLADVVLVNSKFTGNVFRDTFRRLNHVSLNVVYPTINESALSKPLSGEEFSIKTKATIIFLSLNRFERKKNHDLAILALGDVMKMVPNRISDKIHLIIAGGYDERVVENKEYFLELVELANKSGVGDQVSFIKSPSDHQKQMLFHSCTAVIYTPQNEHFGIVPIEAMYLSRPVIACDSGGPLETIIDGDTGFLCEPKSEAFAEKMKLLAMDRSLSRELGSLGSIHVRKQFASSAFAEKLKVIINGLS